MTMEMQTGESSGTQTDPVCGMSVDPAGAREKGLFVWHEGKEYVFCGRGCKLDFEEDPQRYFDPSYVPTM